MVVCSLESACQITKYSAIVSLIQVEGVILEEY